MGIQILTPARRINLTTIQRVKDEGDLTDQDDALLAELLADANAAIESHCRRFFLREKVRETLTGQDGLYLHLVRRPIVSVSSVVMDNEIVTDFRIENAETGTLYRQNGWTSSFSLGWGAHSGLSRVGLAGDIPTGGGPRHPRFTVEYTAGFLGPEEAYEADTISVSTTLPGFQDTASQLPEVLPGDIILVSGLVNENNNGRFIVKARTPAAITVEGPFLVTEAAGARVTINPRNLPRDVERAAILTVKAYLKARFRDPQVTDSVLGPLTTRFINDEKALPPAAVGLLAQWRLAA